MGVSVPLDPWIVGPLGTATSLLTGDTQTYTPPSGLHTYWGAHVSTHSGENAAQAVARFNTAMQVSHPGAECEITRLYDSGAGPSNVLGLMNQFAPTPPLFCPSVRTTAANVLSGSFDAQFNAWYSAMSLTVPTFATYYHEMDAVSGGETASDFANAQAHIQTIRNAVGNPLIKNTIIFTSTSMSSRLPTYWTALQGEGVTVDDVGVDPYEHTAGASAQSLFEPLYDLVVALDGPGFVVGENAMNNVGGANVTDAVCAAYIETMLWLDGKADAVMWFNSPSDAQGRDDEIDPLTASIAAFAALVTHTA